MIEDFVRFQFESFPYSFYLYQRKTFLSKNVTFWMCYLKESLNLTEENWHQNYLGMAKIFNLPYCRTIDYLGFIAMSQIRERSQRVSGFFLGIYRDTYLPTYHCTQRLITKICDWAKYDNRLQFGSLVIKLSF